MIISHGDALAITTIKGDPRRTFRDERGILVSRADEIDRQLGEWAPRFEAPSPLTRAPLSL